MGGDQYCSRDWEIIKDSSSRQKLSYKRKYILGDGYNFYMALLEGKMDEINIP